jgi:hypothetical protein
MRNFAQVLHPHFKQRPVLFSAAASQNSHFLQTSSLSSIIFCGVFLNPDSAHVFRLLLALIAMLTAVGFATGSG